MNARFPGATLRARDSAISRADLLWLLHRLHPDEAPAVAALLGFANAAPVDKPDRQPELVPSKLPPPPSLGRPRLRTTHFAVIDHQQFPEDARPRDDGDDGDHGDTFASLQRDPDQSLPARIPLSAPSRLSVFLRRTLRTCRAGRQIDVDRLIGQLVRLRLPRHLPRQQRPHWGSEAALIVDLTLAAWPLRDDLIDLAEQAHALSAGHLPIYCRDGAQGWLRRKPGRAVDWATVDDSALRNSRHWLLAGDAGSLAGDSATQRFWRRRCHAHRRCAGELTLLTGQAAGDWTQGLPRQAELVAWEHGRRLLAARPPGQVIADERRAGDAATSRLLAALSLAVVVEPPLLRAIRLALGASLACELAAWNHPHGEHCVLGMHLRRERLADYRRQLCAEPLALRRRIAAIVAAHHAGHYQAIRFEEAALAAELAELADFAVAAAQANWAKAARTLQREPQGEAARELASYLGRTGLRAHATLWSAIPALADAYVIAHREALHAGAPIPVGLPASSLARHLAKPGAAGEARRWWLLQRGSALIASRQPPQPGQFVLAECAPAVGFDLQTPAHARQWHPLGRDADLLPALDTLQAGGGPWRVHSAREKLVVAEVPRPAWALAWGRDRQGLYAVPPALPGLAVKLYWRSQAALATRWPPPERGFRSDRQEIARGLWQGADLDYGLYLDVDLAGVVQRFRWIAAGEFMMGSPADEAGRFADEGPRHRVRLTTGYWLAETACTQALWRAVMRATPSRFNDDPANPVERVSWDDVQAFLERVRRILPGVSVELPTEAEWEYACRAGSEQAYNGGDSISAEQANFDSRGTVAVKSYPPNGWGLYEVHGNVWEWCADGKRSYLDRDEIDPRGPDGHAASRVVRGGSWHDVAGRLRSAFRPQWHRDYRYGSLYVQGFRFALRSNSPVAGAERLRQDALEGPQGFGVFPGREDPAAAAPRAIEKSLKRGKVLPRAPAKEK